MPQLFFRYGVMTSAKTALMLSAAHNYEIQDKKVIVMKPGHATRDGDHEIKSRIGIERKANIVIREPKDIPLVVADDISCVLVDEVQFLSAECIDRLRLLSRKVPVICYGLRTNSDRELFAGSKRLFEVADKIEEIKTTCMKCNRKAIYNKKIGDGPADVNAKYIPVCDLHF